MPYHFHRLSLLVPRDEGPIILVAREYLRYLAMTLLFYPLLIQISVSFDEGRVLPAKLLRTQALSPGTSSFICKIATQAAHSALWDASHSNEKST